MFNKNKKFHGHIWSVIKVNYLPSWSYIRMNFQSHEPVGNYMPAIQVPVTRDALIFRIGFFSD